MPGPALPLSRSRLPPTFLRSPSITAHFQACCCLLARSGRCFSFGLSEKSPMSNVSGHAIAFKLLATAILSVAACEPYLTVSAPDRYTAEGKTPRTEEPKNLNGLHCYFGSLEFGSSVLFPWPHRLAVRTPPFHGGNRGSIPLGVITKHAHDCCSGHH
jgi:hypothetical protein